MEVYRLCPPHEVKGGTVVRGAFRLWRASWPLFRPRSPFCHSTFLPLRQSCRPGAYLLLAAGRNFDTIMVVAGLGLIQKFTPRT